ncbi:formimidoylglutamase [Tenacibaculum dicentrarchi]|nr:formimidoylglutamase [Tenacibaculum dicentrarchi]MCD8414897.1 formimidoylglutamase [Tenacibaculum dicentrarchi]MCD8420021.1 formimidoylglutamase [Tenacibaculum dicentrarchi]MCD8425056.1 formimidoylglutamase [Tenacibaculum dicentrarchi]MCD8435089.1 formimidoylglutamase [Tenacibaculum dicentrarchi]
MLKIFNQNDTNTFVNPREGETKIGQCVQTITSLDKLENCSAKFVIIGVPEDIGVKMNYGNGGAHTAFIPALKSFLNIQENQFISGKDILVLGYLDFLDDVSTFNASDREKGNLLVKSIDKEVSELVKKIVIANKIPIIIGGGHNNSYGNLKGLSEAKKQPINVINLDAHTDLRQLEERHSGNGFSYAIEHKYVEKYFMFGLHENYTPQYIFDYIHSNINIDYNTYEELEVYKSIPFENELLRAENFIQNKPFGIEIDLDCIQNFPSSAMTPSGFSPQQTRKFVYYFAKNTNASYIHICEGAPSVIQDPSAVNQVGKFISYLITDFIKAQKQD